MQSLEMAIVSRGNCRALVRIPSLKSLKFFVAIGRAIVYVHPYTIQPPLNVDAPWQFDKRPIPFGADRNGRKFGSFCALADENLQRKPLLSHFHARNINHFCSTLWDP
jgi:hypothetical protein